MASRWGLGWGSRWGGRWGAISEIVTITVQPSSGGRTSKYLSLAIYEDTELFNILTAFLEKEGNG